MRKTIVFISLLGMMACGTYKSITPSQTDLDRGKQKYPDLTMSELNLGKTLFEAKCGKCHSLARPFRVSVADVQKIMPKMAKKAGLPKESSDLVLEYLITMKSAPAAK
jgi:hypothetical protein